MWKKLMGKLGKCWEEILLVKLWRMFAKMEIKYQKRNLEGLFGDDAEEDRIIF
jgi:hypothetical protein